MEREDPAAEPDACVVPPRGKDPLGELPAELFVQIVDNIPSAAAKIPSVCRAWRNHFRRKSLAEPSFRAAVRSRYGIFKRPSWARKKDLSWGQIYLSLSRERCHLCRCDDVLHGAYAVFPSWGEMFPLQSMLLFPVCEECLSSKWDDASMPVVVEPDCVPDVYRHVSAADFNSQRENLEVHRGVLYNQAKTVSKESSAASGQHGVARGDFDILYVRDILKLWPDRSKPGARDSFH